jgi:peptide/nickel transport system substrate-binding protein
VIRGRVSASARQAPRRSRVVWVVAFGLAVSACSSASPGGTTSASTDTTPRGGTLRVAVPDFMVFPPPRGNGLADALVDPQQSAPIESLEILRCCLTRTLLAHRGLSTDRGGAELLPDLATGLPDVSADGLTWTFHMRAGLHYSPPLQATEITTPDIVRGLERTGRLMQTPPYYSIIAGFDAYSNNRADSVSGLETPDPHTLVVHLTSPAGDLGERLTLPPASPIPPLPGHPEAAYGVATGHDDGDSPFLVSSGPYMIEGIDKVDFTKPPAAQARASGYHAATPSVVLVRNPSWSSGVDGLRPAYVDRIVITGGGTRDTVAASVDDGTADVVMLTMQPPQAPLAQIKAYQADPGKGRVDIGVADSVRSFTMNLAQPPFDDVHVRRAVNYAIDRPHLLDIFGGPVVGAVVGHMAIDSLEQDTLVNYSPYRGPAGHGDLDAAKREMALSPYDVNHAGVCGADACKHVTALTRSPFGPITTEIAAELARIGIVLDVTEASSPGAFFQRLLDPTQHIAAGLIVAWGKDYLNASSYFYGQFAGSGAGQNGNALMGASAEQLRTWGYSVKSVPSIDDRITECFGLIGGDQLRCWTALDEYVTEKVVPAAPLFTDNQVNVVPKRVARFARDQAWNLPALDQVALAR